ncbi:MAG: GYF domain-containing protein, partial [Phycisphaerae bacterium]
MEWYYISQNQRIGPLEDDELQRRLRAGTVRATTAVWRRGQTDWLPYRQAILELPADQRPRVGFCSGCEAGTDESDLVTLADAPVCPACKPLVLQRILEGLPALPTRTMAYAGFTIRLVARGLDGMIWLVIWLAMEMMLIKLTGIDEDFLLFISAQQLFLLLTVVLVGIYESLFVTFCSATPGKMICGLSIVCGDGSRVGLGRSAGRYLALLLSVLSLALLLSGGCT